MPTAKLLTDVMQRSGFARPDISCWGTLPPGVQNPLLGATFAFAEAMIAPTPLARLLGAMTFRSQKLGVIA